MKNRAGYDMIAGAEAGLLHLTGERGGGPVRPGLGLTDMSTGLLVLMRDIATATVANY
jgi:succinate--hydroxymethylglutarate CoA-transferase